MDNSRTLNSIKNLFSGMGNKLISLILVFISRKIFITYIGIEYLGISSLFSNILSILSLADLGFGIAMGYSLYRPLAENNCEEISALIHIYKKIYNIVAAVIFVIGLSLIPFLNDIVHLDHDIRHLEIYYILFLLQTTISYLFVYKATIITADQKNHIVNNVALITNIIKTLLQILLVIMTKNYTVYLIIQLIFVLVNNIWISRKADEIYPFIKTKSRIKGEYKKEIYNNFKSVFLYKISGTFMNSIDSICISSICGTVILAYYTNYLIISTNISVIISIVFGSFTAGIGNLIVNGSYERRYEVFREIQVISYYLSSVTLIGFLFLAQDFIKLWLGEQYVLEGLVMSAVAWDLYLGTSFQPLWTFREASGLYMKTKYIMLIAAGLNVILSIILGKMMGVSGVIIASILCRLFTYFWYEPKLLYSNYFGRSSIYYFISYFKNIIFNIIIMCEIYLLSLVINADNWFNWILKGMFILVAVSLNYYLLYRKREEFKNILSRTNFLKRI